VTFTPGHDNNARVRSFTVYYHNESQEPIVGAIVMPLKSQDIVTANIEKLRPWQTYYFYATATNALGTSDPSKDSDSRCQTPQTMPERNPNNVCVRLQGTNQLAIVWSVRTTGLLLFILCLNDKLIAIIVVINQLLNYKNACRENFKENKQLTIV